MKKIIKTLVSALCVTAMCGGVGALGACGNRKENIIVSGSSSVTSIMEKLAAEYEKTHDVRITIVMSSSGAGISDTQNGLNDFGMSSRELTSDDTGVKGETLCMDGIALIVNKDSAVQNVAKADLKALFESGTSIPDTTITAAIGRDASSGTRKAFDELLGIERYYEVGDKAVSCLAETGNVIEAIQGSNNSIGYISFGSLNASVKAVALDGVECSVETITDKSYALQRPFVITTKEGGTLSSAAQGFYDYIFGTAAQTVIADNGYISVK